MNKGRLERLSLLPRWLSGKESACQCRRLGRHGFSPWVRKIPWRRERQPTPIFLPRESPWTEESGRLQSRGSQRVRHHWKRTHNHGEVKELFKSPQRDKGRARTCLLAQTASGLFLLILELSQATHCSLHPYPVLPRLKDHLKATPSVKPSPTLSDHP